VGTSLITPVTIRTSLFAMAKKKIKPLLAGEKVTLQNTKYYRLKISG